MTANRTVRRTLGLLSAGAVLAGAALVVLSPPPGAALSDPGVYGLVLLGGATGLLVALATVAAAGTPPADEATPAPAGTTGPADDGGAESTAPPATETVESVTDSTTGADAAQEETTGTDSIDSVQELFEQVADEEPTGSLLDEDAVEGGFRFGGDRERE